MARTRNRCGWPSSPPWTNIKNQILPKKQFEMFSAFLADEGDFYNDGFVTTTTTTKTEMTTALTAAANSPTTVVTKVINLEKG